METLESLLSCCKENGRVCPQPQRWDELYQLLPDTRQVGAGFVPAAPLILGGWWYSSDGDKQERLALHIRWAADHGALERVDAFLRALPEDQWHHLGE